MIPQEAITRYLSRNLDSHLWIKRLSEKQIDMALAALEPPPKLYPKLRLHQKACFLLGVAFPRFSFWNDMGTGKSILALSLLKYWYDLGVIRRAVVFVTSDKAFSTWEGQFKRFEVDVPYITLEGSSADKWATLRRFKEGIVLVSYTGAVSMNTMTVRGGRGKNKWVLDKAAVKEFGQWAQATIFDESTKCGHRSSLTFALADRLRQYSTVRYNLAGRPFGRDPTMLWVQQYLVDGGESLGETLGIFRSAFFTSKPNFWARWAPEFKFKKAMSKELSAMAQHRSITYREDECGDLPPSTFLEEMVQFSTEAETYYRSVINQAIAARGNLREMENVFLRMRQIASGFVGMKDDDGERVQIEFAENPKLDRLLELADALPDDRKLLVFYEFTHSGRRLVEELKALKLRPVWLWSGTKNSREALRQFQENPQRRVIVVQNRVGAYSLDGLQVANYGVFFESPVACIDREQAEKRLNRQGQLRKVFWYDLLVEGSVDRRIRQFHKEGGDLLRALLHDPASVLG